jgi:2'-5' RNA ligase
MPQAAVRWTTVDNLHLTLRFIGETTPEKAAAFEQALTEVRVEPFILPVEGVGIFPARGLAKVLWAGIGNGHTRLFQLRKQVDEALLSVERGLDVSRFHPHFTLGRLGKDYDARAVAKFLARLSKFEAPPFRVNEFHLMASEARPSTGPLYRSVRAFTLREPDHP